VGTGDQLPLYRRLAEELGIADHVTWTGAVEQPIAEGVFAAASVCCLMSQWEEAFGIVIVEAMASGKPVVATRVGGIPELVEDGRTGFLVARDDVPAMADRVIRLLQDDALRARLGREGRRVAEQKFDLDHTVSRYLERLGLLSTPTPLGEAAPAPSRSRPRAAAPSR
jgi:glycosyltransferase involved in cell wall biosynthesis